MTHERFATWCPYRAVLFCQETEGCDNCQVAREEVFTCPRCGRGNCTCTLEDRVMWHRDLVLAIKIAQMAELYPTGVFD